MNYQKVKPEEMLIFEKFASVKKKPNVRCTNEEHRQACLEYQRLALAMPYAEMKAALNKYDNSHPKMDEIKFVRDLQDKYNQSEQDVLKRIRYVRLVSKILTKVKVNGLSEE